MEENTTAGKTNGPDGWEGVEPANFHEGRIDYHPVFPGKPGFAARQIASLPSNAQAQPTMVPGTKNHYYLPATDKTVHWGCFSKPSPTCRVNPAISSPSR
jgi:hypothetical protein